MIVQKFDYPNSPEFPLSDRILSISRNLFSSIERNVRSNLYDLDFSFFLAVYYLCNVSVKE